jgi:hypothetical protein
MAIDINQYRRMISIGSGRPSGWWIQAYPQLGRRSWQAVIVRPQAQESRPESWIPIAKTEEW